MGEGEKREEGGGEGQRENLKVYAWEEMVACSSREILRFGLPGQWLFLQVIFSK